MQNFFSEEFWIFYRRLPLSTQKQADKAFERFEVDALYPSLKFKCVNKAQQQYAIRINRGYRALGYVQDEFVIWDWIGPHDEYERRIRK